MRDLQNPVSSVSPPHSDSKKTLKGPYLDIKLNHPHYATNATAGSKTANMRSTCRTVVLSSEPEGNTWESVCCISQPRSLRNKTYCRASNLRHDVNGLAASSLSAHWGMTVSCKSFRLPASVILTNFPCRRNGRS